MIGALLPWFGSKRQLAPRIVEALGVHDSYREPFCGSMAVLLAKPRASKSEIVFDLHRDLTNVARVIADRQAGAAFYRRVRRILFCESLHADARAELDEMTLAGFIDQRPNVGRAVAYFVACWMGRNGIAGTENEGGGFCVRYTTNGGDPTVRWRAAVETIPQWRKRLAGVQILTRDGIEAIDKFDDVAGVAIYVDPPYLQKGATYVHDFRPLDHVELAAKLRRFTRARVVVSYYENAQLAELYPDWRVIPVDVQKNMAAASRRADKNTARAPEVLLVNERPPAGG